MTKEKNNVASPLHGMLDRSGILFNDDWYILKTLFDLNLQKTERHRRRNLEQR